MVSTVPDKQRLRNVAKIVALIVLSAITSKGRGESPTASVASPDDGRIRELVGRYCLDCHAGDEPEGGLSLETTIVADIEGHPEIWEKVIRRLDRREMPPSELPRPSEDEYAALTSTIAERLDLAARNRPRPGRTETLRRLTRTEYQYAIRDLLALEIDASALLPADEVSHGFDNVTVTELSPSLLNRHLAAARKISRLAVGRALPASDTFRVRPDITQDVHMEGLPLGTRGGTSIRYPFPQDGEYEIQVHLMRDRNEELEGLRESHEMVALVDRDRVALWNLAPPPRGDSDKSVDANLKVRTHVTAGPHEVGVTFLKQPSSLQETLRQPLNVHFNFYRHPRIGPAVFQVTITGPFDASGPGDTPSRRRIYIATPADQAEEDDCARRILAALVHRAYRGPIHDDDLTPLLEMFHVGRATGGFDAGIELALSAVLVNPRFLFRIESDPPGAAQGSAYQISDIELATRLSFFLWSSIPDDELLQLAERGELSQPDVLEQQARRMLADPRARALVENFAAQWLQLRNLDAVTPDMRLFPDFDDNLRQAMRTETELRFERLIREDRGVLDLLGNDDTFLNERLAKHYHVPHVYGSRFREVALSPDSGRGGLLRQASILTVTSYATRTSPVLRGKWVLENLLASPPPPPPANVPALEDNTVAASLSVRERLAQHRAHAACAQCHDRIDPVGFALEHYDAVGRWRELEEGRPVDATGGLPGAGEFVGAPGLEQALRDRPELFVQSLSEKLLTFALGRGIEYHDAPAIRRIVRESRADNYRFSSVILGIVRSVPFQMRSAP